MIARNYFFIITIILSSCTTNKKKETPPYSTDVTAVDNRDTFYLMNCEAANNNDSLLLSLNDAPVGRSHYEIEILKVKNEYLATCRLTYAASDCTWRAPIFKNLYQDIQLNKENYKKDDIIIGKINLVFSSKQTNYDTTVTDTIRINGLINTIVQ